MSTKALEIGKIATIEHAPEAASSARSKTMDALILALFTFGIFASASLLFIVQPMVGKILLPKLGGAPAVWNTCMLFFQATLLLGYLTAHLLTRHCSLRAQVVIFAGALLLALQTLPLAVEPEWVDSLLGGADPNLWLLTVLFFRVAPVFFVLSITSPLLQKWFARSGHPQGADPYFLYAASNIGSILALLSYPLALEVIFGVTDQTHYWKMGFAGFTLLAALCGLASWYGSSILAERDQATTLENSSLASRRIETAAPTWKRRGYWILLSAIPSSLMLGITTYVSTDVSSIPLIWVIPLTLYLLTFVIAFASRQVVSAYWMGRIASLLILTITVTLVTGANDPPAVIIPMHLIMFFAVAMFCHQRLAADRPNPEHLTDFYLCLSVGGVLGGLFNALVAPALFPTILEYPLAMIVASMLRETRGAETQGSRVTTMRVLAFGVGIFVFTLAMKYAIESLVPAAWFEQLAAVAPLSTTQLQTLLVFGIPACLVLHHLEYRAYFSAGLAAIFLVSIWNGMTDRSILERGRNFYGTIKTAKEHLAGGDVVKMFHGNTVHGWQWTDAERRGIPLTYYGKSSGVGRLIAQRQAASEQPLRIGAIGLGAGTLAATLRPVDTMIYYEINPQVLAHAEEHFTYLDDARARGASVETRLGDARLVLEAEARAGQTRQYDILVIDAFSSDSIPVHLITDECLKIYQQQLKPGGVLAFHITNRYLNLEPVLAALAEKNGLTGFAYYHHDIKGGAAFDEESGETTSSWVLLSSNPAAISNLVGNSAPQQLVSQRGTRAWSDDYSNVLSAFQLRL